MSKTNNRQVRIWQCWSSKFFFVCCLIYFWPIRWWVPIFILFFLIINKPCLQVLFGLRGRTIRIETILTETGGTVHRQVRYLNDQYILFFIYLFFFCSNEEQLSMLISMLLLLLFFNVSILIFNKEWNLQAPNTIRSLNQVKLSLMIKEWFISFFNNIPRWPLMTKWPNLSIRTNDY